MSKVRLLFVVNDLGFFISHRLPIALAAQKAGYVVHVAYGELGRGREGALVRKRFILHHVPISRAGTNPLVELWSVIMLWRLFRQVCPDLVHLVAIKPVLYGGISARLAGVPAVVSAIAGLGFIFIQQTGLKALVLRQVVKLLFRLALRHPRQKLIFQNLDDRDCVLEIARISSSNAELIRGSGIDLTVCPVLPEPDGIPVVAMAARLLRDKGVLEFVAAARLLRERGLSARFWLMGDPDLGNPASVTPQEVASWRSEGVVECLGHCLDVPSWYARANIVTLPSYREGLPKSLIEAAACGRAVITTDVPGCREALEPNVTGLLVPSRDVIALADAIQSLIEDPKLRKRMGAEGRLLAEREFGLEKIVAAHLHIYHEI